MPTINCKQSLYFPVEMYHEIREEARRLDRSISWVIVKAWRLSKGKIKELPGVNESEVPKPKAP